KRVGDLSGAVVTVLHAADQDDIVLRRHRIPRLAGTAGAANGAGSAGASAGGDRGRAGARGWVRTNGRGRSCAGAGGGVFHRKSYTVRQFAASNEPAARARYSGAGGGRSGAGFSSAISGAPEDIRIPDFPRRDLFAVRAQVCLSSSLSFGGGPDDRCGAAARRRTRFFGVRGIGQTG